MFSSQQTLLLLPAKYAKQATHSFYLAHSLPSAWAKSRTHKLDTQQTIMNFISVRNSVSAWGGRGKGLEFNMLKFFFGPTMLGLSEYSLNIFPCLKFICPAKLGHNDYMRYENEQA